MDGHVRRPNPPSGTASPDATSWCATISQCYPSETIPVRVALSYYSREGREAAMRCEGMTLDKKFTSDEVPLAQLLEQGRTGALQLPDFQRGWVWDDNA